MAEDSSIIRPSNNGAGASLQRVGFGTTEIVDQRETQGAALAARAQAEVQARYIVALQRPRNVEQFRVRLLEHCKRPGFAAVAEYEKPVGGRKIKGPSIRFVETALQVFGNVLPEETITYDDDLKRVTMVKMTDLETNITYSGDVIVEKTVERRNPKDGDEILGSRLNSYKETVYKIRATEDDFANKIGAACSKKIRNLGIRILPADIVAEAMDVCRETRMSKDAQDPASARRQLADAFAALRVMPTDLDAFLGHAFDQASPAELEELRGAYVTVREGEAKWTDLVDAQRAARGEIEEASKPAVAAGDRLRSKIEARRKAANEEPKHHKVVDATSTATAAPASVSAPVGAKSEPKTASPSRSEERACAMCGVPLDVPSNTPPGARCEACANS